MWYYYDVPKKDPSEPCTAQLPQISQIPAMGGAPEEFEDSSEPVKNNFRPTDTKYIQLCKMGGRSDLLRFRENDPKTKDAKGYPRCDWYYLEDNAMEDKLKMNEEDHEPFVSSLPEYMVHDAHPYTSKGVGVKPQGRCPFAVDSQRADKMDMKIPEPKAHGYGVRQAKYKARAEAKKKSCSK